VAARARRPRSAPGRGAGEPLRLAERDAILGLTPEPPRSPILAAASINPSPRIRPPVNSTLRRSLAAPLLLLAGACAHIANAASDDAATRLERHEAAFHAAAADRDAERVAAFFADDAVLHVAGMPEIRGREAIGRFYANMYRFLAATRATPVSRQAASSGDLAYSTGRTVNEFRGPDGEVSYAGKYALVWTRHDGEWLVSLYAVSSDQPDAAR
jgi:uncharacterized protein (TIGR02246 family)